MLQAFEIKDGKYKNQYLESKNEAKIEFDTKEEVDLFLEE